MRNDNKLDCEVKAAAVEGVMEKEEFRFMQGGRKPEGSKKPQNAQWLCNTLFLQLEYSLTL
jgi:hypothetical protein